MKDGKKDNKSVKMKDDKEDIKQDENLQDDFIIMHGDEEGVYLLDEKGERGSRVLYDKEAKGYDNIDDSTQLQELFHRCAYLEPLAKGEAYQLTKIAEKGDAAEARLKGMRGHGTDRTNIKESKYEHVTSLSNNAAEQDALYSFVMQKPSDDHENVTQIDIVFRGTDIESPDKTLIHDIDPKGPGYTVMEKHGLAMVNKLEEIIAAEADSGRKVRLSLSGHSLGGAFTQLFYAKMLEHMNDQCFEQLTDTIDVVLFQSPGVNEEVRRKVKGLIERRKGTVPRVNVASHIHAWDLVSRFGKKILTDISAENGRFMTLKRNGSWNDVLEMVLNLNLSLPHTSTTCFYGDQHTAYGSRAVDSKVMSRMKVAHNQQDKPGIYEGSQKKFGFNQPGFGKIHSMTRDLSSDDISTSGKIAYGVYLVLSFIASIFKVIFSPSTQSVNHLRTVGASILELVSSKSRSRDQEAAPGADFRPDEKVLHSLVDPLLDFSRNLAEADKERINSQLQDSGQTLDGYVTEISDLCDEFISKHDDQVFDRIRKLESSFMERLVSVVSPGELEALQKVRSEFEKGLNDAPIGETGQGPTPSDEMMQGPIAPPGSSPGKPVPAALKEDSPKPSKSI